jgi:hypothetical protein
MIVATGEPVQQHDLTAVLPAPSKRDNLVPRNLLQQFVFG